MYKNKKREEIIENLMRLIDESKINFEELKREFDILASEVDNKQNRKNNIAMSN